MLRSAIASPSISDPIGTAGVDMTSNPMTLGYRKLRNCVNMMVNEGVLRSRYGFYYQGFGVSGQFQGAYHYSPSKGLSAKPFALENTALVVAAGGKIFVADTTNGTVACTSRPICGPHDFECRGPVNLFQAENWLIVQNERSNTHFWPGFGCLLESPGLADDLPDADPALGKAPAPTRGRCWSTNTYVQITVLDQVTGQPIRNATVRLKVGNRTDYVAQTDAYGEVLFYPVPKTYTMEVSAATYVAKSSSLTVIENDTKYLKVFLVKDGGSNPFLGLQVGLRYDQGSDPCDPGHICNSAIFDIFANDVLLGRVNLNNGFDGGSRSGSVSISPSQSETIAANSPDGKTLSLRFQCATDDPEFDPFAWDGGCHPNVGHLTVTSNLGTEIYDGCAAGLTVDIDVNPAP